MYALSFKENNEVFIYWTCSFTGSVIYIACLVRVVNCIVFGKILIIEYNEMWYDS